MKNQNEETESQKKSIEIKTVADVVRPNWLPGIEPDKKYILVGLHCCGDLSSVLSQLAVDKIEIVGIVLVPCCYHHLTEVVDLNEAKIPNIKSQFVTGIGRGLEDNKLVTTEVENPEETYIGRDSEPTIRPSIFMKLSLGKFRKMLVKNVGKKTAKRFRDPC